VYVFQCRSEKHSIFELGLWGNLPLVGAVLVSGGMHAAILYHPALQEVFQTTGLSLDDWLLVLVFAMTSLFLDTLWRMLKTSVRKHFSMVKV
jgi:Ca2+-transporting ATPase